MRVPVTTENDEAVEVLRKRMDEFYQTTSAYDAFNTPATKGRPEWVPVGECIRAVVARKNSCRVLEFGCGRTGFGTFLGELRSKVQLHLQDVTDRNKPYLDTQAEHLWVGDVRSIKEKYDVIFSTYVWEHVTEPRATLSHLLSLLEPGGSLFIFCPRYDLPGYVPPSARHYPRITRMRLALWLAGRRLTGWLFGRPDFLIHTDPSLFHRPWYRDADAIHWPAWNDLKAAIPKGYNLRPVECEAKGFRDWIRTRILTLAARVERAATP